MTFPARLTQNKLQGRISQLSAALFRPGFVPATSLLRYQLLFGVAALLIEARRHGAQVCVFLVHEFHSATLSKTKLATNAADLQAFIRQLYALPSAV